jgi:hypothetical protein
MEKNPWRKTFHNWLINYKQAIVASISEKDRFKRNAEILSLLEKDFRHQEKQTCEEKKDS